MGVQEYAALGYSMTGSVAPWLAHRNPRVQAVVSGGFPSVTSYASLLPYIEANRAETKQDAVRWANMTRKFDADALLAWYQHLDTNPTGLPLGPTRGLETLQSEVVARGIPFESIPGKDHESLLADINIAMPGARSWLASVYPPGLA